MVNKEEVQSASGQFIDSGVRMRPARLCIDLSHRTSARVLELVASAGLKLTLTPVSGLAEPELTVGPMLYRGFSEIRNFVETAGQRLPFP